MCNEDTKGNFLIRFISKILFQLKFIFQKKKTTPIFARFSRNFNPCEWLDSKSDQLYLSHIFTKGRSFLYILTQFKFISQK